MDIGFGEALLIVGLLLAVAAALSGVMHGTVLSVGVLSVSLGIVLALAGVVSVKEHDQGIVELIELALVLTLISDGLLVERELLTEHWSPPVRALALAMPLTLVVMALGASLVFPALSLPEAFLLAAVLAPTDPVVTSGVLTARRVPEVIRHTLNLESGLNDGLALPFVLFFIVFASPTGDAGNEGLQVLGEAAFGVLLGAVIGFIGGRLHRYVPGGVTARYEGIYAIGFGLAAFGIADVTFGNGLIAAFVAGIVLGATEHEITERFVEASEDVSVIFQVITFFVFGALVVSTGYHASIPGLIVFVPFAILIARPAAVLLAFIGTGIPTDQKLFISWFGPKGVASMLFALYVLDSQVKTGALIFDIAAYVVLASVIVHGFTDTIGARWIDRRMSD